MRALIQRVKSARVTAKGTCVSSINRGMVTLLGIGTGDTREDTDWLINKILSLRIFPDGKQSMAQSIEEVAGEMLVVSQITLFARLDKGKKPDFSAGMPPDKAKPLYEEFMRKIKESSSCLIKEGVFGAMMEVELINDGPVTFWIDSKK